MKRFLAVYTGSAASIAAWHKQDADTRRTLEAKGMKAWTEWGTQHASAIVDHGSPLGKTKRVSADGIKDTQNNIAAYVIVQAESHEAAAKLFHNHPHFSIFPGDGVEIMELMPIPAR